MHSYQACVFANAAPPTPAPASRIWAFRGLACRACTVDQKGGYAQRAAYSAQRHSGWARLRKAIKHTCRHQPGPENKCRLARSASSQRSPSTSPGRFSSNSYQQRTGNWAAGPNSLSSTKTLPLPSNTDAMHIRTLTVLEPGRKRKRDNPQEWARQMRAYNCPPCPHSLVNVPDQMPYKNVHKTSANTLIKVPRRPNRSDPRIQSPCASPCI